MSLHRKWSNRVHQPMGSRWPASGSVAECLSWHSHGSQQPHENYGILKGGPQVTFDPRLEVTETSRISGTLETRVVTPCPGVHMPQPPSRNAWSAYNTDGVQPQLNQYTNRAYSPQPPDVFRDTVIQSQRPGSKLGAYETSKMYDVYQEASDAFANQNQGKYDPEKEELIRDFLTRKEIESYDREIEHQTKKLRDDTHRAYEDHLRNMALRSDTLHESTASAAVKAHLAKSGPSLPLDAYYDSRLTGRPPLPKPPRYGQVHYPKTAHPRKFNQHDHRVSRPNSAVHNYQQDCTRNLDEMITGKRVAFQTPRIGSAASCNRGFNMRKGEHFSQWRDAASPALKSPSLHGEDQLWKMNRFTKSAQPRISTRWDRNSRIGSGYREDPDKNKVNVNVQCSEGDNMDVALNISHSPSKMY